MLSRRDRLNNKEIFKEKVNLSTSEKLYVEFLKMYFEDRKYVVEKILGYTTEKGTPGLGDFNIRIIKANISNVDAMAFNAHHIEKDNVVEKLEDVRKRTAEILDRAVSFYPEERDVQHGRGLISTYKSNIAGFDIIHNVRGTVYIELKFIEYVVKELATYDKELAFQMMDKYVMSKLEIIFMNNMVRAKDFFRDVYMELYSNEYLARIISKLATYDEYSDNINVSDRLIMDIMSIYVYHSFNNMLHNKYDVTVLNQFISIISSPLLTNGISSMTAFKNIAPGMLGLNDSIFDTLLHSVISKNSAYFRSIRDVENNVRDLEERSSVVGDYQRLKLSEIVSGSLSSIHDLNIRMAKITTDNPDIEYEPMDKPSLYSESFQAVEGMNFNLNALDCGKLANCLTMFPETTTKLFSEFLGVKLGRTDREIVNHLSRKVDRCIVAFEFMSTKWAKTDALDNANKLLGEIDSQYDKAKTDDHRKALDAVRNTLANAMVEARKIDIKKARGTVTIDYNM